MHEQTSRQLYQALGQWDTRTTEPHRLPGPIPVVVAALALAAAPAWSGPPGKAGCQAPLVSKRVALSPWESVRRPRDGAESWADPSSFAVAPDGTVTILSPDASRLSVFGPGGKAATVSLPQDSSFEDFVFLNGQTLLLSRAGSRRGVYRLAQDSSIRPLLEWPDEDVPDPGLVTALEAWGQGAWAIVEDEYSVRIPGPATEPAQVVPGTSPDPRGVLRAIVSEGEITVFLSPAASGAPLQLVRWPLQSGLHALHLVARLDDGRVLALLSADGEQRSPEVPPDVTGLLLTGAPGQLQPCRSVIPWDAPGAPPFEPLRRARRADNRTYYWRATRRGVEIRLLTP